MMPGYRNRNFKPAFLRVIMDSSLSFDVSFFIWYLRMFFWGNPFDSFGD